LIDFWRIVIKSRDRRHSSPKSTWLIIPYAFLRLLVHIATCIIVPRTSPSIIIIWSFHLIIWSIANCPPELRFWLLRLTVPYISSFLGLLHRRLATPDTLVIICGRDLWFWIVGCVKSLNLLSRRIVPQIPLRPRLLCFSDLGRIGHWCYWLNITLYWWLLFNPCHRIIVIVFGERVCCHLSPSSWRLGWICVGIYYWRLNRLPLLPCFWLITWLLLLKIHSRLGVWYLHSWYSRSWVVLVQSWNLRWLTIIVISRDAVFLSEWDRLPAITRWNLSSRRLLDVWGIIATCLICELGSICFFSPWLHHKAWFRETTWLRLFLQLSLFLYLSRFLFFDCGDLIFNIFLYFYILPNIIIAFGRFLMLLLFLWFLDLWGTSTNYWLALSRKRLANYRGLL
jgi:hypothetical protein